MLIAPPSFAQQPDTLAVPSEPVLPEPVAPAETLAMPTFPAEAATADTLAAPPAAPGAPILPERPIVPLGGPAFVAGTPPARAVTFGLPEHVERESVMPGLFRLDLGVPGAPDGLSVGGMAPHRLEAVFDGRPAHDLFTGRPLVERLPEDLLVPVRQTSGRLGSPDALAFASRAFAAEVPITEARYRAGPEGLMRVGVTHVQTRRPGLVQRLGGDDARLRALVHIESTEADGFHTNARVGGWQLVARLGVALPGFAVEITERHQRRTEGAWGGLAPEGGLSFARAAPVQRGTDERFAVQNDLSLAVRAPLLTDEPLALTLAWTTLRNRFTAETDPAPTRASGDRLALHLAQDATWGGHRLGARLDAWLDHRYRGTAFGAGATTPEAHLTVTDSLGLAGFDVRAGGGVHLDASGAYPSAHAEAARPLGPVVVRLGARHGGARRAVAERLGFGPHLVVEAAVGRERTTALTLGASARLGPMTLALDAEARQTTNPRVLLLDEPLAPARAVTAESAFERALVTLRLGVRDDAPRGLYGHAALSAHTLLNPDASELHRREAAATPDAWGHVRLGARARNLFDGALDLDAFARVRGWTEHRGRTLHAPTALFVLPAPGTPPALARPVLDAGLEAGLAQGRARFFLTYENALAGSAFSGTYAVPVYPIALPALRVGLFWVLAG